MALEYADRPVRPITVDEALRMLDVGILQDGEHVELLHGVLVEPSVSSPRHVQLAKRVSGWLWDVGPDRLHLQHPLIAPDRMSMPEPDIAVVEPGDEVTK